MAIYCDCCLFILLLTSRHLYAVMISQISAMLPLSVVIQLEKNRVIADFI